MSLPSREDWQWVLWILFLGTCLGVAVNLLSPRGFNMAMAAGFYGQATP